MPIRTVFPVFAVILATLLAVGPAAQAKKQPDVPLSARGKELHEAYTKELETLRAEGVVLRPMGGYGLPHCLRITVGLQPDMDVALAVLRDWRAKNPPPATAGE